MVKHLASQQPELGITEQDIKCVRLAGLTHDLGHGPFSHLFDNTFIPQVVENSSWKHEQGSEDMLEALITNNPVDVSAEELRFIKDLIRGKPSSDYKLAKKPFLFEIVANTRNSIDVDKFDYIQRDCLHSGLLNPVDVRRIIPFSRVIDGQICYYQPEATNLLKLFMVRYFLYKQIYTHKGSVAIELMVADAMIAANRHLKISDAIYDPTKYLLLNDSILNMIECSENAELEKARSILGRLRKRDLYRLADQIVVPHEVHRIINHSWVTPKSIADEFKPQQGDEPIDESMIIVQWLKLNYGMKDKNPLDKVMFYTKYNMEKAHYINKNNFSLLLPGRFEEVILRCYSRHHNKTRSVQLAFRALLEKINTRLGDPNALVCDTETEMQVDSNMLNESLSCISGKPVGPFVAATPLADAMNNPFLENAEAYAKFDESRSSSQVTTSSKAYFLPDPALDIPVNFRDHDSPMKRQRRKMN